MVSMCSYIHSKRCFARINDSETFPIFFFTMGYSTNARSRTFIHPVNSFPMTELKLLYCSMILFLLCRFLEFISSQKSFCLQLKLYSRLSAFQYTHFTGNHGRGYLVTVQYCKVLRLTTSLGSIWMVSSKLGLTFELQLLEFLKTARFEMPDLFPVW